MTDKKWQRPAAQKGVFSAQDKERAGYIGNEFVIACRHCEKLHRYPVQMNRESLRKVRDDIDDCIACYRPLDPGTRLLSPRNSELREMEKAARWMTHDRNGVAPTCQELWTWLERSAPIPIEPADYNDCGFLDD